MCCVHNCCRMTEIPFVMWCNIMTLEYTVCSRTHMHTHAHTRTHRLEINSLQWNLMACPQSQVHLLYHLFFLSFSGVFFLIHGFFPFCFFFFFSFLFFFFYVLPPVNVGFFFCFFFFFSLSVSCFIVLTQH